jgi:ribosome-associated translation inhibitor RaiA
MVEGVNPNHPMKLSLSHRHHAPSVSLIELVSKELEALQSELQIDEAKMHFERSLEHSPPFSVSFHLVTPGPDLKAAATDHTFRAATLKAFAGLRAKLDHRDHKRARNRANGHVTTPAGRRAPMNPERC